MSKLFEVFTIFLRLGLTSFGGPIAHIGFFHDEFVKKRKWLDEHGYADLVALCQFLPGPASSQVGMAVGLSRAGIPGALLAWLGFTLPSVMLLVLFSIGISSINFVSKDSVLHGLKIAAVAIVAQAILEMGKNLCPDRKRASIAILASIFVLQFPSALVQVGVIVLGGILDGFF
jgi:chromate transporter